MQPEDRRFMAYWKDQRGGSKTGYYVIYTLGWGVVIFFVFFFFSKLFTNLWETGGPYLAFIFGAIALVLAFFITNYIWKRNEKRMHRLIKEDEQSS